MLWMKVVGGFSNSQQHSLIIFCKGVSGSLDVHGLLLVGIELAALGCLFLLGIPLTGHLGLLAVAAAHGFLCWWWFLHSGVGGVLGWGKKSGATPACRGVATS
jgi:hypothetical protein